MSREDAPTFGRVEARPAPRTPVERANDQALEHLIFAARVTSVFAAALVLVALALWVWTGDARWGLTAALEGLWGGVAGWWGWWVKGNEEWRDAKTER